MLGVLGLIDVTIVANLLTMVIIGGYATFVSRLDLEGHADRPEWLIHIDPGTIGSSLKRACGKMEYGQIRAQRLMASFSIQSSAASALYKTFGQWLLIPPLLFDSRNVLAEFGIKNRNVNIWNYADRVLQVNQVLFGRMCLNIWICDFR